METETNTQTTSTIHPAVRGAFMVLIALYALAGLYAFLALAGIVPAAPWSAVG